MKIYINIVVIYFLLFLNCNGYAQDLKQELLKMRTAYKSVKNMHAKMRVFAYASENDEKNNNPISLENIELWQTEEGVLYKKGNNDVLINDHCQLIVNHDKNMMMYSKIPEDYDKNKSSQFLNMDLDSIFNNYDEVKYIGLKGKNKLYKISISGQAIKGVYLYIDTNTLFPSKVVYAYNDKMYQNQGYIAGFEYTFLDFTPNLKKDFFHEKRYVLGNEEDLIPTEKYKNYNIINMSKFNGFED